MPENSLSLSELNGQVSDAIRDHLPDTYCVRAETSDVRLNRNGHCYLEFIEKIQGAKTLCRARELFGTMCMKCFRPISRRRQDSNLYRD